MILPKFADATEAKKPSSHKLNQYRKDKSSEKTGVRLHLYIPKCATQCHVTKEASDDVTVVT